MIIPVKGDKSVNKTVGSILAQKIKKGEILVVRNSNISYGIETDFLDVYLYPGFRIDQILLTESGKANALNYGIKHAKYELVAIVDADCVLDSHAFAFATDPFKDSSVFAVGGKLIVLPHFLNILSAVQEIEYKKVFNISRRILNKLDCNYLVSGAFGVFRKDDLLSIGGFNEDTVGEDLELILRVHRLLKNKKCYKVLYEHKAVCFTEAPKTLKALIKQRERWQRGFIDSVGKNIELLFDKDSGLLGRVVLPLLCLEAFVGPVAIIIGSSGLLDGVFGPYYFLCFLIVQVVLSFVAEFSDKNHEKFIPFLFKAVFIAVVSVVLQLILSFARVFGAVFFKKRRLKW